MTAPTSGRPFIRAFTATTTAQTFYPPIKTKFAQIKNEGAVTVDLYFDSADAGTSTRAITLQASGSVGDYIEGPYELSLRDEQIDTRGGITLQTASSTAVVRCVFIQESV